LKTRLENYHKETTPVLEFYKKKGTFAGVNGDQPFDKVWEDLRSAIDGKI
jgi:adenylate kinase